MAEPVEETRDWHAACWMDQQEIQEAAMKSDMSFFQLISSVVGLSIGIGVVAATALLGVAALLQ